MNRKQTNKYCVIALVALIGVLLIREGPPVHAQTTVVTAENISTPAPAAPVLPTITPMPGALEVMAEAEDDITTLGAYEMDYIVREGDTLWSVALEVGLDLEAAPCIVEPYYTKETPLIIGNRLLVPPAEYVCHQTLPGETLGSIAALYNVPVEAIVADGWNDLDAGADPGAALSPGRYVRILADVDSESASSLFGYMLSQPIDVGPIFAYATGGPLRERTQPLVPENWPFGSGYFDWPAYGWITQGYRYDHRAVDIAAQTGTFVTAADRGEVLRAGWNEQGYGLFVIIDHHIDYVTLYAHLAEIYVEEGDIVAQGQVIGAVGSTGNSTGPHLHFEVRDFGSRINPLDVLLR